VRVARGIGGREGRRPKARVAGSRSWQMDGTQIAAADYTEIER